MKLWERSEQRQVKRFYGGSDEMYAAPRPRPDLDPGQDLRPEIDHIVVLMMENHSFDNYFGCLGKGTGFVGQPSNPHVDGTPVPVHQFTDTTQHQGVPSQSWHASHIQWNHGANDGFVRAVEETVQGTQPGDAEVPMGYWTATELPFYSDLARTFPLADRWFCSCLGPTFPNRRFLIAGTATGLIDDIPLGMVDYPKAGTIFDLLNRNNISWVNYHDVRKASVLAKRSLGRGGLRLFRQIGLQLGKVFPSLLQRTVGNLQFTADLYPLGLASSIGHLRNLAQFFDDAQAGTLPSFCIVDPNFSEFSEENPQDISKGEGFAAAVVNAVTHGKKWDKTLLIWTYDEPGGYYDSVPPPAAVPPDDIKGQSLLDLPGWSQAILGKLFPKQLAQIKAIDGDSDRAYDNYGCRVPTVLVSPYARRDCTISETFDHTSILKLVEEKWNLPALTQRDATATAPWAALDFTQPPPFQQPPQLAAPRTPWALSGASP